MRALEKIWDGAFGRQGLLLEIVMTNPSARASVDYAQTRLCAAEESKGTGW